jgi:hypothetical protein
MKKFDAIRFLQGACFLLAFLASMLVIPGCSANQVNVAAKSIITANEVYDATMQAASDAYKKGVMGEEGKEKILKYGNVAYSGIAAANTALLAALDAGTKESETALDAAVRVMKGHLFDLIEVAVSFGVELKKIVTDYRGQ